MDSDELVVDFQVDAGRRIIAQLVRDAFDAKAVFWVKTAEEGIWFLYVATPLVEQKGLAEAYRVLQASMQKLPGIPLSLSDIKLVGADNPIAKDVLRILARYPGRVATRYGGKQLGSMTIDDAYIYPQPSNWQDSSSMAKEDVLREIFRLMNRGPGILQPSRIMVRDGSSFEGIPFSIQMGSHRAIVVQFIDNTEPVPRVVDVDEIVSIS
jgi:hypothetical protein